MPAGTSAGVAPVHLATAFTWSDSGVHFAGSAW